MHYKKAYVLLIPMFCTLLSACGNSESYTLYRGSPVIENARIHVATFDANEKEVYNIENCQTAAELFKKQQGVTVKYWCEKGRYKK
jgi:hypothetical protein